MQSFTFGSDEGMDAVVTAQETRGESYPMTLNTGDFTAVVFALLHFWDSGPDNPTAFELRKRAGSLLSGMAETLGVEFVSWQT